MTYGDKIRSMTDNELAKFLSQCVIPDDEYASSMFIYGVGHFGWTDDLEDALGKEVKGVE